MGFRIERAHRALDEARTATDASRSTLEDMDALDQELADLGAADELEVVDEDVRERLRGHIDTARGALGAERRQTIDQLAAHAAELHEMGERVDDALVDAQRVRASLEGSSAAQLAAGALNELIRHEEELQEIREDLANATQEAGELAAAFSAGGATLDTVDPEGARRREALDKLTEAAEALGDLEDYVLSDADQRLQAARTARAIPMTGDAAFDEGLRAYVMERSDLTRLESYVADTRLDDTRERADAANEYTDAMGSVFSGVISAAAGVAILAGEGRRRSSRKGGA